MKNSDVSKSTQSAWDFVPQAEIDQLRTLKQAVVTAQAEKDRLEQAAEEVADQIAGFRRPPSLHDAASTAAAAAAKFLGEPAPAPGQPAVAAASGDSPLRLAELQATSLGLSKRRSHADMVLSEASAKYRVELLEVIRRAANLAATAYVETADRLAELWAALDGVDEFARTAVGGGRGFLPDVMWGDFLIPGTEQRKSSPALSLASHTINLGPVVFSGKEARQLGSTRHARERMQAAFEAQVGPWPFPIGRVTFTTKPQEPERRGNGLIGDGA